MTQSVALFDTERQLPSRTSGATKNGDGFHIAMMDAWKGCT